MTAYLQIRTDIGTTEARPITMQGWGSAPPWPDEPGYKTVEAAVPDGVPPSQDEWEMVSYNELTGETAVRPALPNPVSEPVRVPATLNLSAFPGGTVVTVANSAGDELGLPDLTEPLILVDRGEYTLRAQPPFPWTQLNIKIEVI